MWSDPFTVALVVAMGITAAFLIFCAVTAFGDDS